MIQLPVINILETNFTRTYTLIEYKHKQYFRTGKHDPYRIEKQRVHIR